MPIPNCLADFAELQKVRFIDSGMLQAPQRPPPEGSRYLSDCKVRCEGRVGRMVRPSRKRHNFGRLSSDSSANQRAGLGSPLALTPDGTRSPGARRSKLGAWLRDQREMQMNISLTTLCLGVFCDCGRITAYSDITRFWGYFRLANHPLSPYCMHSFDLNPNLYHLRDTIIPAHAIHSSHSIGFV
jgi:hypothetical protein